MVQRPPPAEQIKKILAPVFAVALLSVLVLHPTVGNAIGQNYFVAFVYLHLFFYPAPSTVGQHIETVALGLFGLTFSLSVSFLALAGTVWHDDGRKTIYSSPASRAIGICTYLGLVFFGALLSVQIPRFKSAVRIALFSATWILPTGANSIVWNNVALQFYPAVMAAGVGVVANLLIFPHTAQHSFARVLTQTFADSKEAIGVAVTGFFDVASTDKVTRFEELKRALLASLSRLDSALEAATLEPGWTRVQPAAFGPLLRNLRRIRAWIDCGMGLQPGLEKSLENVDEGSAERADDPSDGARIHRDLLRPSIEALTREITHALAIEVACLELVTGVRRPRKSAAGKRFKILGLAVLRPAMPPDEPAILGEGDNAPDQSVLRQRRKLSESVIAFRESLQTSLDSLQKAGKAPDMPGDAGSYTPQEVIDALFRNDVYDTAFMMVSLLEIAQEAAAALRHMQAILRTWHGHPRRSLSFGCGSWALWWSRAGDGTLHQLAHATGAKLDQSTVFLDMGRSPDEDDEGEENGPQAVQRETLVRQLTRLSEGADDEEKRKLPWSRRRKNKSDFTAKPPSTTPKPKFWRRPGILTARLKMSELLRRIKHSRSFRFAIKLTAGVGLLSLPAWIPGPPRDWYIEYKSQWMILSYIWCLETSTGSTIRVSLFRIAGTIVGVAYGITVHEIASGSRWALAVLITLFEFPAAWVILFTQYQGVGVVAAFTQPVISLLPFISGLSHRHALELAGTRAWQISIGIVASLIVNVVAWPYHARTVLVRHLSRATQQMQTIYLSLARQMLSAGMVTSPESTARFEALEKALQARLVDCRGLVDLMSVEIALVPKPTETLRAIIARLQKVADLLYALRQCREAGLQRIQEEAIFNVLDLRRDLVSTVLMTLWVTGQALRSHSALPQFLPSPRAALHDLTAALKEQLYARGRTSQPDAFHALRSLHRAGVSDNILRQRAIIDAAHAASWRPRMGPVAAGGASPISTARHRTGSPTATGANTPGGRTSVGATFATQQPAAQPSPLGQRQRPASSSDGTSPSSAKGSSEAHPVTAAYFFVFAEHYILAAIVAELEGLVELVRSTVGESTFMTSHLLPQEFVTTQDVWVLSHQNSLATHAQGNALAAALDAKRRSRRESAEVGEPDSASTALETLQEQQAAAGGSRQVPARALTAVFERESQDGDASRDPDSRA